MTSSELLRIDLITPRESFKSSLGMEYVVDRLYTCYVDSEATWYCVQDTLKPNRFEWFPDSLYNVYFQWVRNLA